MGRRQEGPDGPEVGDAPRVGADASKCGGGIGRQAKVGRLSIVVQYVPTVAIYHGLSQ
jgi:serine acetyltransferase